MGRRDLLDHKLVWINTSNMDWGPKSFKVLMCWYEHKEFKTFIHKEWNSIEIKGSPNFIIKEKLKFLRGRLRRWNLNVLGKLELKI